MNQQQNALSLLAPQATGGDIAEGGFQYQTNWIIACIPKWLAQDGFTEMIREALGDVEAKFFVPGTGIRREFIEYKNHNLQPSKFWEEVENFWEKDLQVPNSYLRFVLVCTSVSDQLKPVINALHRVRDAFPFYDGAMEIQHTSYNQFVEVVTKRNKPKELADFIFSKVDFNIDRTDAEDRNRELFRETLLGHFPVFANFPVNVSNLAYLHLSELIRSRKNQPIYRHELEDAIWKEVEEKDKPKHYIRIHTLHDENADRGPAGCLQFDWKIVFGGPNRNFPPTEVWKGKVNNELHATKEWLVVTNSTRRIRLSGHRRLSASIAIGATFSSVSGFTIGIETKDGIWWTNSHAKEDTPDYHWHQSINGESNGEIAVGISILKDTANADVERYLKTKHFNGKRLYLYSNAALQSDAQTNVAVQKAKLIIQKLTSRTQSKKIHLFFAGPAQFALFLGHRLNTLGEIQCYEWLSPEKYVPTALIGT